MRNQAAAQTSFTCNDEEPYNTPFSEEEIHLKLKLTEEISSGYQQITYSYIKKNHITLQTTILNLYNETFMAEVSPVTSTVATITPISYPGKEGSKPLKL